MYDADSKNVSYNSAFWILVGLGIGGLIIGSILSIPVWMIMGTGSILDMQVGMTKPENVGALRVIQVVSTAFTFFLPAYFTAVIINRKPLRFLGFNNTFNAKQILAVIGIMLFAATVAAALGQITEMIPLSKNATLFFKKLEDTYAGQVEAITNMKNVGDYVISLIMIALLPAVFEETFFRGGMQNILTRSFKNPWQAIIITSVVFSIIHFSYYGFLARVCLGMVLGLIYYHSQTLWLSISAHFFNNAFAVTQMYIMIKKGKTVKEAMNDTVPFWWGLIGIIALYLLFVVFKKLSAEVLKKKTMAIERNAADEPAV